MEVSCVPQIIASCEADFLTCERQRRMDWGGITHFEEGGSEIGWSRVRRKRYSWGLTSWPPFVIGLEPLALVCPVLRVLRLWSVSGARYVPPWSRLLSYTRG